MSLTPSHIELIKLLARQVVAEHMGQNQATVETQTLTDLTDRSNNQPAMRKQNQS